jgi:hypothetical protein
VAYNISSCFFSTARFWSGAGVILFLAGALHCRPRLPPRLGHFILVAALPPCGGAGPPKKKASFSLGLFFSVQK